MHHFRNGAIVKRWLEHRYISSTSIILDKAWNHVLGTSLWEYQIKLVCAFRLLEQQRIKSGLNARNSTRHGCHGKYNASIFWSLRSTIDIFPHWLCIVFYGSCLILDGDDCCVFNSSGCRDAGFRVILSTQPNNQPETQADNQQLYFSNRLSGSGSL